MNRFLEIKPGYVDSGAAEGKSTAWTRSGPVEARDSDQGRGLQAKLEIAACYGWFPFRAQARP